MKGILIYVDKGASPRSVLALFRSLKNNSINSAPIQKIDQKRLLESNWENKTSLLIFPGGRDIPYHEALKGAGTKKIRSFVENGGCYLGFCAGAYFGTSFIEFEMGGPLEVKANRELSFFPGKAIGPAYGNGSFSYEDERGGRLAKLNWNDSEVLSYYNGGCLFENAKNHPNTEILATYTDLPESPAAIINCQIQKGRAILCGVHPEYDANLLKQSKDPYLQNFASKLEKNNAQRKRLFSHILEKALCQNKY